MNLNEVAKEANGRIFRIHRPKWLKDAEVAQAIKVKKTGQEIEDYYIEIHTMEVDLRHSQRTYHGIDWEGHEWKLSGEETGWYLMEYSSSDLKITKRGNMNAN